MRQKNRRRRRRWRGQFWCLLMLSTLRVVFLPAEREDEGQWCKIINKGGGANSRNTNKKGKRQIKVWGGVCRRWIWVENNRSLQRKQRLLKVEMVSLMPSKVSVRDECLCLMMFWFLWAGAGALDYQLPTGHHYCRQSSAAGRGWKLQAPRSRNEMKLKHTHTSTVCDSHSVTKRTFLKAKTTSEFRSDRCDLYLKWQFMSGWPQKREDYFFKSDKSLLWVSVWKVVSICGPEIDWKR